MAALLLASDWRWMALALALFAAGRAPLVPLVDVLTVQTIGPARESYGRIRVWGSVPSSTRARTVASPGTSPAWSHALQAPCS